MEEIKPQYQHSKLGQLCFNISAACTKFFIKHKILYYVVSILGNFIMTFIGCLITLILYFFIKEARPIKYYGIYYMKAGPDYGGGFDTGLMFVRDQKSSDDYLNTHEGGHSISQGVWLGPLFPFVVAIPSAIRWWARELNKKKQWPDYNAVGFEDAASECGKWAVAYLEEHKK